MSFNGKELSGKIKHRDDMYSLSRQGVRVKIKELKPLGKCEQHMFRGGGGDIISTSLVEGDKGIAQVSGFRISLGPPHSHESEEHEYHIIEDPRRSEQSLGNFNLRKTRRKIKEFRASRRETRS